MRFPWQAKTENYTTLTGRDRLINALILQASGVQQPAVPTATAALEAVAGLLGRCFAVADVAGPAELVAALTPDVMTLIGRQLVLDGDTCYFLDTSDGLEVVAATSHSVTGGPLRRTWRYDLQLGGPTQTTAMHNVDGDNLLHMMYSTSPSSPWRGASALGVAIESGRLSAATVAALADESAAPHGSFMATPKDGNDPTLAPLKADARTAHGDMLWVESMANDWDGGKGGNPNDYKQSRFGASPPAAMVELLTEARREVWAAHGINAALWEGAQSAALREAWRTAWVAFISPCGQLVQTELRRKLSPEIEIGFSELRASDLQGRARSLMAMVNGGMALADAVAISGLMVPTDTN